MSALMAADVLVSSVLLGPLTLRAETVITFAAGLPGFPALREFALVETQRDELVWLQSVDEPSLTFLLGDPFALVPGFTLDVPAADVAALGLADADDAPLVLAVLQLDHGAPVSANLQSPIVINREQRGGRQVVLPDSRFGMQHPITIS